MTNKDGKSENSLKSLEAYYQNFFGRKEKMKHCSVNDDQNTNRKSSRSKTTGIVALTSFEKPIVTNIYDIAPEGVSFLSANEKDVTNSEFKMDILIFDCLADFEYFIGRVKGRVKAKKMVYDPKSNAPIWRFGVEFMDLDTILTL